ncbi:AAA family ATPase [Limobrevibacterium gyesilva]|uniref:AAA family ATPase n=1 Tax=Limobrevibacterium gyesilva TaxID=2991712 RepID=A0AA41YP85_9PROT|nr:AAA family ATPase [Limobrevibacterium gyesilva]MCW3477546.1 AAA family ATPase [Limobrevibacterium gyesilva]
MSSSEPHRAGRDHEARRHHWERRAKAAGQGRHLPTFVELLRGMPFCGNDLGVDAQTFAERLVPRLHGDDLVSAALRTAMISLTFAPDRDAFSGAIDAFRAAIDVEGWKGPDPVEGLRRCEFYAAACGCNASAWRVAGEAISLAYAHGTPDEQLIELAEAAVGWLLFASGHLPSARRNGAHGTSWLEPRTQASDLGERMVRRIIETRRRIDAEEAAAEARRNGATSDDSGIIDEGPEAQTEQSDEAEAADDHVGSPRVIVFSSIGNDATTEGKQVSKEFASLLGQQLPLVQVPDLRNLWSALLDDFPHADPVIAAVLDELLGCTHVRLRPLILYGSPGCGKTTFGARLLTLLGLPHEVYSCGGVGDSSLAGTARRWSTGEPSLPVSLVRRHRLASPAIILDEIEKVGESRRNGNLLDALLGLLEPRSAACWHDPYIEAPVDLSHIVWIATANSVNSLPAPLRDRCRLLPFPDPGPEHLEALASRLLCSAVTDRCLDPRWALPLTGEELAALAKHWRGGSLRRLARLVEAVFSAREDAYVRQ